MMRDLHVRLGDTLYRVERPFFTPEPSAKVSDVAVDASGRIHVLLRVDPLTQGAIPSVSVLTPEGDVIERYGADVLDAHSLTVDPRGSIWIVDRDAHRLIEYRDGMLQRTIGAPNAPGSPFNHPAAVAFGASGMAVAGGYADATVHIFDADLAHAGRFGSLGRGPEQLSSVHGIWQAADGTLYVADRNNGAIKRFSRAGELLACFDALFQPQAVTGRLDGMILVSDSSPTLTLLTPDLRPVAQCRPVDSGAHGIAIAADGSIYMAEPSPNRVSRLTPCA